MTLIARNASLTFLGQVGAAVLGVFALRGLSTSLGSESVGLVILTLTLQSIVAATLDLGLSSTIVREVASVPDPRSLEVRRLLQLSGFVYWGLWLGAAGLTALLSEFIIDHWLKVTTLDRGIAARALAILGAGALLVLPRATHVSLFRGLQRMHITSIMDVSVALAQQVTVLAIVWSGGGLLAVATGIAAVGLASLVAYHLLSAATVGAAALLPSFSWAVLKRHLSFTSRMTGVSVLAVVHTHSDKAVISKLLRLDEVAIYTTISSFFARLTLITAAVSQAAFPHFTTLHARGSKAALVQAYEEWHRLILAVMLMALAVVPFASPMLAGYIFGADAAQTIVVPSILLAVGYYMNSTLTMPHIVSLSMNRPDLSLSLNALALAVVLPTTVLLVAWFGLTGAAASWVAYHVFAYFYFIPRFCRECLERSPREWFRQLGMTAAAGIPFYIVAWLVATWLARSAVGMTVAYCLASAAYLGAYWRSLPEVTKHQAWSLVRSVIAK